MNFLPNDYKTPKSSNYYAKLVNGENKFRILSQPLIGWEDWIENKPVRYRMDAKPHKSHDSKKPMRHFWSMIVWNYTEDLIQILHITQSSIQESIEALANDQDWGLPYFYDIKIIRSGEGMKTQYAVNPLPHKSLNDDIQQAFIDKPCCLEALFDNADPFSTEWDSFTPGMFHKEKTLKISGIDTDKITISHINDEQAMKLADIIAGCQKEYREELWNTLKGLHVTELNQIPKELFPRILAAAEKKRKEAQMLREVPF